MAVIKTPATASKLQHTWGIVAVALSVALATASAWPVYETPRLLIVAAVGFGIGTAAVILGSVLHWRWWATASAAGVGYLVAAVPVAIPSAMASPQLMVRGVVDALLSIVLGWKRLLTVSIPAGEYQAVLVPFLIVVVIGTVTAVALIVHGGKWAPLATAPMVAMVSFGAIFGSSVTGAETNVGPLTIPAPEHVVIGSLTIIVCCAWLIARAQIARSSALKLARSTTSSVKMSPESLGLALRRHTLAVLLAAVSIIAGVALAPVASSFGGRDVARDSLAPVEVVQAQPSPLSSYRAWFTLEHYDQTLFTVTGADGVDRLRIATLDDYDGQVFHVSSAGGGTQFTRQPHVQDAVVSVTIGEGYSGVWVPLVTADAGAPQFEGERAAELAAAYYANENLDFGVLATDDAASGFGLREGDTYLISVGAPTVADGGTRSGGAPLISADDYPALAAWVEEQNVGRSEADLVQLITTMRDRGFLSHSARSSATDSAWTAQLKTRAPYNYQGSLAGHSKARVEEIFTAMLDQERRVGAGASAESLVAGVGDDEQFATAAALLARYLGYESRVVIGVRLGAGADDSGVEPCVQVCTGANVTAWAESRTPGGEWLTLDATPQFILQPSIIREGELLPENLTEVEPPSSDVLEPPKADSESSTSTTSDGDVAPEGDNAFLGVLLMIVTVVGGTGLIVVPFIVFPFVKFSRRRWRRTARVPEVALVGAWEELVSRYVDLGIDVPRNLTREETADVLERPAASALATLVDTAVFAEHPPGRESSEAAWEIVENERRDAAYDVPMMQRLRSIFTPASLLRDLRSLTSGPSEPHLLRKDRS